MRRVLMATASVFLVGIAFSLYAQVSQKIVTRNVVAHQPKSRKHIQSTPMLGPTASLEMAERYLPEAPWSKSARFKIRADGMHLFFENRKIVNGGTELEVSPIAIVWSPPDKDTTGSDTETASEPVVVLAKKASIVFDTSVQISEIRTRMIREIGFGGGVIIRGQDGLHVAGSNFVFSRDNQHLRSDLPLEFRYKNHHGVADKIQLNFKMLDGGQYADNPRFEAITDFSTRDHLELSLGIGDDEPPLLVTAEGSMQYQFETKQATLNQDVVVLRTDKEGFQDSLECDVLKLQFHEVSGPAVDQTGVASGLNSRNSGMDLPNSKKMELSSVVATGNECHCQISPSST